MEFWSRVFWSFKWISCIEISTAVFELACLPRICFNDDNIAHWIPHRGVGVLESKRDRIEGWIRDLKIHLKIGVLRLYQALLSWKLNEDGLAMPKDLISIRSGLSFIIIHLISLGCRTKHSHGSISRQFIFLVLLNTRKSYKYLLFLNIHLPRVGRVRSYGVSMYVWRVFRRSQKVRDGLTSSMIAAAAAQNVPWFITYLRYLPTPEISSVPLINIGRAAAIAGQTLYCAVRNDRSGGHFRVTGGCQTAPSSHIADIFFTTWSVAR